MRVFSFAAPSTCKRFTALVVIGGAALIASFAPATLRAATPDEAVQLEARGDLNGARRLLEQQATSGRAESQLALAEFLDRHRSAGRRDAFVKLAALAQDPSARQMALRQVLLLDFEQHRTAALCDLLAHLRKFTLEYAEERKHLGIATFHDLLT